MDAEQRERIKDFEKRQNRKEKRDKFREIVVGDSLEEDGFFALIGPFALPLFFIRLVVGLIVWLVFFQLIKKAFKRTKK